MACDIVVSDGGRLTIICDEGSQIPQSALLQGHQLFLVRNGEHFHLGELVPSVRDLAQECNFAMYVVMDGFSVKSSTEIGLQID